MSVIWRKVWRDLWRNWFRTALVVVSTAVGVFALGFVFGTSDALSVQLSESHRASVPSHLTFYTSRFDQEDVETVLRLNDIVDAEGEALTLLRWRLEGEEDWKDGILVARRDFTAQHLNRSSLVNGTWPSGSRTDRALAIERMSSRQFRVPAGSTIIVEFGKSERDVLVSGVARHPQAAPPPLSPGYFFATPETFAWLTGQDEGFNQLHVRLGSLAEQESVGQEEWEESATLAGDRLQKQLERMGLYVGGFSVTDPSSHPVQFIVEGVGIVLMVLGVLALGLSGFLIVNMMNALVTQQVWQIGVMKVVGATGGRVTRVYLATALLYGLLALLLAVPAGAIAAYLLTAVLLNIFNVSGGSFRVMPRALGIQIAAGLIVPLLAALVPVIAAARITPHQAISNYGLGAGFGQSWLDRLIGGIRVLPRPLTLSLRNTFRRKPRIVLTLITLVLGGIMFMVVMSVGTSISNTIEVVLDDFGFDALIVFRRAYRVQRLVEVAEGVPGVSNAEVWNVQGATLELPSGEDLEGQLWAVPFGSEMFRPRIVEGRDFLPGEGRVMLLNSKIAADEGIQVGDQVTLTIANEESTWTVVGLIVNLNNLQRDNFVPFEALSRETGSYDRGAVVMAKFGEADTSNQGQLIRHVREAYGSRNMPPLIIQTAEEVRQSNMMIFNAIIYLFMVMAVLAALVGSVGLMSTMSINVTERSREIGVMRAIGARSFAVLGVFVAEGILVGVLSWVIAVPLSYPGSLGFNHLVSKSLFSLPLDFNYSLAGVVLWLVIVIVLSAFASLWPALRATQVSVRESLAYE